MSMIENGEGKKSSQSWARTVRNIRNGSDPSLYDIRRVRSRGTKKSVFNTESARIGIGQPFNVFHYDATFQDSKQVTVDENHPYFRSVLNSIHDYESQFGPMKTKANLGGPFSTTKYYMVDGGMDVNLHSGTSLSSVERLFRGRLQAYSYSQAVWPSIDPIDQSLLVAYGNKARAAVNPTNPATQTGTGLGELRDVNGVPSIPGLAALKERVSILRAAGREYLNVEFGWKPLESDVKNAALEVKKSVKLLRQYEKSRGSAIRRRFSFDPTDTVTLTDLGSHSAAPTISSAFFDQYQGRLRLEETFKQQVWFSGCFTYYVSPGLSASKLAAYEAAANKLLGVRLTPELIWNLTPWTWLSDWFVDLGSIINGLQSLLLDGSVMWYGYVMASQYREAMYTLDGVRLKNASAPISLSQRFIAETKQRQRATPFGFGLDPNGFSQKQWTILAALGISRLKW